MIHKPIMQLPHWYAVYTRSRSEKKLLTQLEQKGIECFLPLRRCLSQRVDRKKWLEQPLIPSYLFVYISEREFYEVLNTPGAVCYVSFEGQPASIPDEQIEHLRNIVSRKPQNVEVHFGSFAKGDLVEVSAGPLKGIRAEVVQVRGKERLLLRFDSLGYYVLVEMSLEELIVPVHAREEVLL